MLSHAIELLLALLTLSGLVYTALALLAARSFARSFRRPAQPLAAAPAVSLLKPLKGADDDLPAALESHCLQQYTGPWEILCAVSSPADPAVAVVAHLQAAYPHVALKLIVCPDRLGTSGKVSNLVQTLPSAQFDHILINDSDIHVGPNYLARIMAGFSTPGPTAKQPARPVGMVTAPYRGRAHADPRTGRIPVWSRLEALGIATEFLPGVLTARMLESGIHFGLGSTLAMRRDALVAAGGLEPLLEVLADDYELGARIARAGFRVELSAEVVETSVPPYTLRGFFDHQLRWSRSTRDSRRLGYLGLGITFVVPWAFATCLASGFALPSLALLSLALAARTALALAVGVGILRDGQVLRDLWLLPLRDLFALFFWIWSYAGDTVLWRGERFRLHRGKMLKL
jgi:ceramide glucosyltransferase